MPTETIQAQRLPPVRPPEIVTDPEILAGYLEDASAGSPGRASGLARPTDESEAASLLRVAAERSLTVLFQAARSSLTGGAVPRGEIVVSVERMRGRGPLEARGDRGQVTVQPGLRLSELETSLAAEGFYFPPIPTYRGAMVGGTVATNAGGAASFKYGVTRQWVLGLRVLLANGELLVLERGQVVAPRGGAFRIVLSDGRDIEVPVPDYVLPAVNKISAGYHASDPMDLVDLFVGAEGTLGLVTAATLALIPRPAAVVTGLVFVEEPRLSLLLATALRDASLRARETGDRLGPDVRSIEWLDQGSLQILRRHEDDRRLRIRVPERAREALLFEVELPEPTDESSARRQLEDYLEHRQPADGPLIRLFRILEDHRTLDDLELAFPGDDSRRQNLADLREAVPSRVHEILSRRRLGEPKIRKLGGDLIVPFEALPEMLACYRSGFERRGLEYAIWGHLSDGNLHPNVLPRDASEVVSGQEAQLEFAAEAARLGGSPLSEHGVGRNAMKQEILRRFLGADAVETMRRIKRALDPDRRLSPGVLFPT